MIWCKYCLLIIFLLPFFRPASVIAEPSLASWAALEAELSKLVGTSATLEDCLKNFFCKQAHESRDVDVLRGMVSAYEYPLVSACGLAILQKIDTSAGFDAAIRIISMAKQPLSPVWEQAYKVIEEYKWTDKELEILSNIALHPSVRRTNILMILRAVPVPALSDWVRSSISRNVDPDRRLLVADRLLENPNMIDRATQDAVDNIIKSAYKVPGFSRYIYVLHADTSESNYEPSLISVLSDITIDDFELKVLAHHRRKYLGDRIEWWLERTPQLRRSIIQRAVEAP